MQRPSLIAATVAVLAVCAPASALAQGPWGAPQTLSSPATFVDAPGLVFAPNGQALATWRWQDGVGASATGGWREATATPLSAFGPQRPAPGLAAGPVAYGSSRAVLLESRATGVITEQLGMRFGSAAGTFGATHVLARGSFAGQPALATAPGAGHVVAAWIERRGDRRVVVVATRAPGGVVSRPQVVRGSGRADQVSAAINDGGNLVVAWERSGRLEARTRRAGHGFGKVEDLGPAAPLTDNHIVTAVTITGRVYVAWSSRALSEGGGSGPFSVRAAVRPAGPHRFRAAQVLEGPLSGAQPQEARLALGIAAGGTATLAWTAAAGPDGFAARVATTDAHGVFGPAATISAPGDAAAVSAVAVRGDGETLVVWSSLDAVHEVGVQVVAALRRFGAIAFGAPEVVSPATEHARVPAAAFDPRTGRPVVIWSGRIGPEGPGVPLDQIRTFARLSARVVNR